MAPDREGGRGGRRLVDLELDIGSGDGGSLGNTHPIEAHAYLLVDTVVDNLKIAAAQIHVVCRSLFRVI